MSVTTAALRESHLPSPSSPSSAWRDAACAAILDAYAAGTRFQIGADSDGLLRAGVPGLQLTWMDAKVGERVITPRIGKPVEVQALWINALRIGVARWSPRWRDLEQRASAAYGRFVTDDGALLDVIELEVGRAAGLGDRLVRIDEGIAARHEADRREHGVAREPAEVAVDPVRVGVEERAEHRRGVAGSGGHPRPHHRDRAEVGVRDHVGGAARRQRLPHDLDRLLPARVS